MNTKESFHCILKPVILIDSVYKKMNTTILKRVLEKYYFNKDIETYSNKSYYLEPDEEYYDEKCIDLFLGTKRKILQIYFLIGWVFFYILSSLGLKVAQVALHITTKVEIVLPKKLVKTILTKNQEWEKNEIKWNYHT